jgi:hypothetical protein
VSGDGSSARGRRRCPRYLSLFHSLRFRSPAFLDRLPFLLYTADRCGLVVARCGCYGFRFLLMLAAACCCALVLLLLHLLAVRPSFPANTPHLAANLLYHHFPLLPPCQLSFRVYLFQYPSSFPHLLSPPPLTSRPHPSLTLAYPKPQPHPCPPANAPR